MFACLSTSSPLSSVAVFSESGKLLGYKDKQAINAANCTIFKLFYELLDQLNLEIKQISGFIADVGPGSFTGIKVAVTAVKTLGFALNKPVAGISSFDLIDFKAWVAVPIKRGQYLIRKDEIIETFNGIPEADLKGYGIDFQDQKFPLASCLEGGLSKLKWVAPIELLPEYILEPSISIPKKPFKPLIG